MKIEFIKPPETGESVKATIHINGKMGFSKSAIKKFGLDEGKLIKIGLNTEDKTDTSLYVVIKKFDDGESLKVLKAGQYYYVNSKTLFDNLKIDYKNKKIIYDVEDFEYSNIKMYKFVRRELDRTPNLKNEIKDRVENNKLVVEDEQESTGFDNL